MDEDAAFFREQAAKCRRLARTIYTDEAARRLIDLAEDYEQRACALEETVAPDEEP
jgi:hypothetical protein